MGMTRVAKNNSKKPAKKRLKNPGNNQPKDIENNKKLSLVESFHLILKAVEIVYKASPKLILVLVIDAILFGGLMSPVTSLLSAKAINYVAAMAAGNDAVLHKLILVATIEIAYVIADSLWTKYVSYWLYYLFTKAKIDLAQGLFQHYYSLKYSDYERKDVADTFARAQEFVGDSTYLVNQASNILMNIVRIAGSVAVVSNVSWWITLLTIVCTVPGIILSYKMSRMRVRYWDENADSRRYAHSIQSLMADVENVTETKLYRLDKLLINKGIELTNKQAKESLTMQRQMLPASFGASLLERGVPIGAIIWTAIQIINRRQPIGNLALVSNSVNSLQQAAASLGRESNSLENLAKLKEYVKFMELPADTRPRPIRISRQPKLLQLKDIDFKYPNAEVNSLSDISLDIHAGDHIAIVGANGAGKTTLTKIICGLYEPSNGEVAADGKPLEDINQDDWFNQIAMLTQQFTKYTFATVKENVIYGNIHRKFDQRIYDRALQNSEATDFVSDLPFGEDTYMDSWTKGKNATGIRISGGQWQRLALARSFYRNAPIIILDEPTSAIDAAAEARIFQHLFEDKTKTIIVISHRLSTIKKADKIYMLSHGRIVQSGTYDEMMVKGGRFYNMFKSQM